MALRSPIDPYAPEEYLALERAAEFKSEYIDGEIVAMMGGSRAHSLIGSNVLSALHAALREQPCEVHGSDLRVTVADAALYTYPDVTVICGEPVFEDEADDTLMNPVVIVEVLSASTEAYDRGKKFARYRLLPSLRAYVLVSQDQPRVEWYTLSEDGWLLHEANGMDGTVEIAALGSTLALAEIYAKVSFKG
jgi:Uma2 family endonuclease